MFLLRTFQIAHEFARLTVLENLRMVPAAQSGERLLNAWFRPQRVTVEEAANRQRAEQVRAFLNLSAAADRAADFGFFPEKFLPVCYITCIRTHTDNGDEHD